MITSIIEVRPTSEVSIDSLKFGAETLLTDSAAPGTHPDWDRKKYLEDLNRAFSIAAHNLSTWYMGNHDLSQLTSPEKDLIGRNWRKDLDEVLKTSISMLEKEHGVNVTSTLPHHKFTNARKIDWRSALTQRLQFCSKDEPHYWDTDIRRMNFWNTKSGKDDLEHPRNWLSPAVKFSESILRHWVDALPSSVPSHTLCLNYPSQDGEYIGDISKIRYGFKTTADMYDKVRCRENMLSDQSLADLSDAFTAAVHYASLWRDLQNRKDGQSTSSKQGPIKKCDLEKIAKTLASWNSRTSQPGKTLLSSIREGDWASVKSTSPHNHFGYEREDIAWKSLGEKPGTVPQRLNSHHLDSLQRTLNEAQAEFDISKRQYPMSTSVASFILGLYAQRTLTAQHKAHVFLCKDVPEEEESRAE